MAERGALFRVISEAPRESLTPTLRRQKANSNLQKLHFTDLERSPVCSSPPDTQSKEPSHLKKWRQEYTPRLAILFLLFQEIQRESEVDVNLF